MKSYVEVLEMFPNTVEGKAEAWEASSKFAKMVVNMKSQGRFGVGVRSIVNEVGQSVYAVVLVKRTDADAEE